MSLHPATADSQWSEPDKAEHRRDSSQVQTISCLKLLALAGLAVERAGNDMHLLKLIASRSVLTRAMAIRRQSCMARWPEILLSVPHGGRLNRELPIQVIRSMENLLV